MLRKLFAFCLLVFFPMTTAAQTDIFVQGSGKLYPLAVPQLCLQEGETDGPRVVPDTVAKNLDLSGYFEVLNPSAYIETPGKCEDDDSFAYSDWSVIGAEGLIRGVIRESGGQINVRLYLHDVPKQKVVLGKEYEGHVSQLRAIAHKFSNEVMRFFTGQSGPFGSQIAFSSRVGRFKELFVMDMDGENVRQLTDERGLALTSAWNPLGSELIYTSYRKRIPNLYTLRLFDRSTQQVTRGRNLEIGGQFSQDGKRILAAQTTGKQSDIVLLNLDGTLVRKITNSYGVIDVSPKWSPDYRKIVFCSNRSGGPQIYTMNADGSEAKRISFVTSNYCTSPSWSPKGDRIAFVCRADRGFQLFSAKPDGSDALQLTSYGSNEDPEWSPDGRFLAFATTFGRGRTYHIGIMRSDGSNLRQLSFGRAGEMDPAWGPLPG